ncbi:hypothetical protein K2E96_18850 [Pseudomonas sp. ERGC3:05]|nr:hypothetical protein [Pseudomonas sp. ERGC3:01]QZC93075.1 hypothetical protein K2E96_18850 [Pseudomonas sp. ERGC3:05]
MRSTVSEDVSHVDKTVQMRARDSLYLKYRTRGRKNSNLWVVYSPKSREDMVLNSDLELIYWLYFIESDPLVTSFRVCEIRSPEDPDFLLNFTDGQGRADYLGRFPDVMRDDKKVLYDNKTWAVRFINTEELSTLSKQALRWLKPIAYAAAIRDKKLTPLHNALIVEEAKCGGGTVQYLLDQLPLFDSSHVVGMLMRHFVEGRISFDLVSSSFGNNTIWKVAGGDNEQI